MDLRPITDAKYRSVCDLFSHELGVAKQSEEVDLARQNWFETPEGAAVHRSAKLHPRAEVDGESIVWDRAYVGPKCVLSDAVLWSDARITGESHLINSTAWRHSRIRQKSRVIRSEIGEGCEVSKKSEIRGSTLYYDSIVDASTINNSTVRSCGMIERSSLDKCGLGSFCGICESMLFDTNAGCGLQTLNSTMERSSFGDMVVILRAHVESFEVPSPAFLASTDYRGALQMLISGNLTAVAAGQNHVTFMNTKFGSAETGRSHGVLSERRLEVVQSQFQPEDNVHWPSVLAFLRAHTRSKKTSSNTPRRRLLTHSTADESVDEGSGQ